MRLCIFIYVYSLIYYLLLLINLLDTINLIFIYFLFMDLV